MGLKLLFKGGLVYRFFVSCIIILAACTCKADSGSGEASAVRSGAAPNAGTEGQNPPLVAVSILPQTYFTGRIGGDHIRTAVLVGSGQNPHDYEPSPKQIADLAGASVWILSGTEFERGLKPKIAAMFPNLKILDGTEGVKWRAIEEHEDDDHDEEISGEERDPHTWLGREQSKILAGHILDLFISIDEKNAALYQENYDALIKDIDAEFDRLAIELAPLKGKTVFVYHPSFGYFLDEFGIVQEAVETGGKEPTPRTLNTLIEKARNEKAAAIFVQSQFPVVSAGAVAVATGAILVPLDPLAPDWLSNIRAIGEALKQAIP
jgi:zinc transport system substrate-binding protein